MPTEPGNEEDGGLGRQPRPEDPATLGRRAAIGEPSDVEPGGHPDRRTGTEANPGAGA